MPEDRPEIEIDFEGEMNAFAGEARDKAGSNIARIDRNELSLILGQLIRPVAEGLESVRRETHDHSLMLTALGKVINAHQSTPAALESIQQNITRLGSIETANQKLFDALHGELKSYKDNFLFDALQRPYIRDLVSLFDDLSDVHAQITRRLDMLAADPKRKAKSAEEEGDVAFLRQIAGNLENQVHHMIEVFLRMDVTLMRSCPGAPWDKKNHRTVSFEPADSPETDSTIVRSIKPGFFWRERTIRPEDVVVHRWTPPDSATEAPAN